MRAWHTSSKTINRSNVEVSTRPRISGPRPVSVFNICDVVEAVVRDDCEVVGVMEVQRENVDPLKENVNMGTKL